MKITAKSSKIITIIENTTQQCPICDTKMINFTRKYYKCNNCKYLLSLEEAGGGAEVIGIDDVRNQNFVRICSVIKNKFPENKKLLDVGCSRGLFLKLAGDDGFTVTGIEPDKELSDETKKKGFHVLNGFFPESSELENEIYDIIIFNDSMEHIPDIKNIINGIEKHLAENGIVVINIPTSEGLIYKVSLVLDKIGIHTMYDRMWQKGFSSPHIHYFNRKNLREYFIKNGFEEKHNERLKYYTIDGLWKRLICKSSLPVSIISWVIMVILYPLFLLKSDCFVSIFTKKELTHALYGMQAGERVN